ncbi:hypothetical protein [Nocardia sp. NPDC019395]|uniref:hypothetical protein n=1 Tax=Nocardia sp. NPDC019395 TaxID=3154686 RepID=UPI0033C6D49A
MWWAHIALSALVFGMLGSIGYTILIAWSIERDDGTDRTPPTLERLLRRLHE